MSMDVCSRIGLSDNVNDLRGLCMNTLESTHGVLKVLSVDELGMCVNDFLNIQDGREEDPSFSVPCKSCEIHKKGVSDTSSPSKIETGAPEKSLSKCATFPCSGTTTSEVSTQDDNVKSPDPSGFRSVSLPSGLKPVSAMKGSREQRGAAPAVKLTVKWAPDVYDPVPSSVSHVATNNRRHSSSKKNSKNKQKKSSRGSKGKEKKQVRKRGGGSGSGSGGGGGGSSHKLEMEEVVDFPELFCGSSFLKSYGTSLHLSSVAEAT